MAKSGVKTAIIASTTLLTPTLRRFVLRAQGWRFPVLSAGSHVLLGFGGPERVFKNAYSIVSRKDDGSEIVIIVRRAPQSRGGSVFLHEQGREGLPVTILGTANLFPIMRRARRHVLLSAGIGITPFLAYLETLRAGGMDYVLHHFCRPEEREAFESLLHGQDSARVHIHDQLPEAAGLREQLANQPITTHVYYCGPEGFMDWVAGAVRAVGFVPGKIHSEHFFVPEGGQPFDVVLARSGRTVNVGADETLLEALEAADLNPPCMCRGGACGACAVTVLDGQPDHRDHVLTEAERTAATTILTCVSRAKTQTLTLDL